jgi:fructokinase
MAEKNRVFCCGNIAYDLVITNPNHEGGFTMEACPGGSVFNASIMLSRLGLDVSVISLLAGDFLSDSLVEVMKHEKISTRHIKRDKRLKTALAIALIDKKGDSSYIFYRDTGPKTAISPGRSLFSSFSQGSVFHTGSSFSYADFTSESAFKIMKKAREKNMFTTYDPNWRESRIKNKGIARKRVKKFLDLTNLVKLSVSDAIGITGEKTLSSSLKKLPGKTVLTMGEKGSLYWNGKKTIFCPALKVKVVDTIGAGDAFTAGLLLRYCMEGKENFWNEMPLNLAFASRLAAMVCSSRGATSGLNLSL